MTRWASLRFGRADSRVEGGKKPRTSRDDSLVVVLGGRSEVEVWDDLLGEVEVWEGRFEGGRR